jgi:acyl dehydratase
MAVVFGGVFDEARFQIPAKAGTTIRALACFKSGVVAGALFFGKGMVSKGMSRN